jgi:hypothetical protein
MNTNMAPTLNAPPKIVYTVVTSKNGKSAWVKLGAGWINSDGSLNLKLDAYPANGTLQVRDNDRDAQRPFDGRRGPDAADAQPREAFA